MDVRTLFERYKTLLAENRALKHENDILRARLGVSEPVQADCELDPPGMIRLFMSLFKRRDDVFAKRWENWEGKRYALVCLNGSRISAMPLIKCGECHNRSYAGLDEKDVVFIS